MACDGGSGSGWWQARAFDGQRWTMKTAFDGGGGWGRSMVAAAFKGGGDERQQGGGKAAARRCQGGGGKEEDVDQTIKLRRFFIKIFYSTHVLS